MTMLENAGTGLLLDSKAAIHSEGTRIPWKDRTNVYPAGHRLEDPNTKSFRAFFDLNGLENGDEVLVTDSDGKEYIYRVCEGFVMAPSGLSATEPVEGKNVLTLQTCTLPGYSERSIVRAKVVDEA